MLCMYKHTSGPELSPKSLIFTVVEALIQVEQMLQVAFHEALEVTCAYM